MSEYDMIEQTEGSRFRKLALCVLALIAIHVTQIYAKEPITMQVVFIDSIVVLSFVASNVLDKAFQTGAIGNLGAVKERIIESMASKRKEE